MNIRAAESERLLICLAGFQQVAAISQRWFSHIVCLKPKRIHAAEMSGNILSMFFLTEGHLAKSRMFSSTLSVLRNCLWPQAFHKVDCAWGVRVEMMLPQSWSSKPPKCQAFRPMCVQLWSARMPRSAQAGIQRIILCYLWALKKYNTWNFASTSLSCLLCTSGVSCIPQCPPINLFTNTLQIPL